MTQRISVRLFILAGILFFPAFIYFTPAVATFVFGIVAALAPLWLPVGLFVVGAPLWLSFVRAHFVASIPYTTIELKPGPETPRTARAMELVFYSLYHRTDISLFEMYGLGHLRMPWSFEITAHAGLVRFYVHVPNAHRAAVESRIRAEYRDIDIDQVQDYAREIQYAPTRHNLHMREFTLAKADPYPLKTYVSHENERHRRDVFGEILEEIAQASEHEYVCISLMVRPHQRERRGFFSLPKDYLHEDARKEIVSLLGPSGDVNAVPQEIRERIAAIENALKKPSFDCGLRVLYLADKNELPENDSTQVETLFDKFGGQELNSFTAYDPRERISWPLSEIFALSPTSLDEYLLRLYRRRAFFTPPYYGKAFVLNTEELATIFHIPHFARASALSNIRSIRLEPPLNLPV